VAGDGVEPLPDGCETEEAARLDGGPGPAAGKGLVQRPHRLEYPESQTRGGAGNQPDLRVQEAVGPLPDVDDRHELGALLHQAGEQYLRDAEDVDPLRQCFGWKCAYEKLPCQSEQRHLYQHHGAEREDGRNRHDGEQEAIAAQRRQVDNVPEDAEQQGQAHCREAGVREPVDEELKRLLQNHGAPLSLLTGITADGSQWLRYLGLLGANRPGNGRGNGCRLQRRTRSGRVVATWSACHNGRPATRRVNATPGPTGPGPAPRSGSSCRWRSPRGPVRRTRSRARAAAARRFPATRAAWHGRLSR